MKGNMKEKEFQIALARLLTYYGFEVYFDKNVSEFPTFRGDKEKPDLLVFYNKNNRINKIMNIQSPFAIETKIAYRSFNSLSKSILQIKKYNGKEYYTDNWKGKIKNVFLSTEMGIKGGLSFEWSLGTPDFNLGVNWAIIHILFSVSQLSGVLIMKDNELVIETPNLAYELKGGNIEFSGRKTECIRQE